MQEVIPLTDSLVTDIVLLSSYLSVITRTSPSDFQNYSCAELNASDHLATLFNVGNFSHDICTVVQTDAESAMCTVLIPTTPSSGQLQGPQSYNLQSASLNPKKGAEVLDNWDHDNE